MKKRKDGRYVDTITVNGKRKYFYGNTKREVIEKIAAFRETEADKSLFSVVINEWWEEHETTLSNNTIPPYYAAVKRAIEYFGSYRIESITPSMLFNYISYFAKGRAEKTVKTQIMIFNLVFRYAVLKGYVLYNPARELKLPKNLKKTKIDMPSDKDIAIVKNSYNVPFGDFAYWALYTGLRKGELLALTWEDVDQDNMEITVNKSVEFLGTQPHLKPPKTEKGVRTVPILKKLQDKIKFKKHGVIFHDGNGEYIKRDHYNRLWANYKKETGTDFNAHQLRHAYATMLYENQIPEKDAQYLLGHAQISTTMDIYAQIRNKQKKAIADKVFNIDI